MYGYKREIAKNSSAFVALDAAEQHELLEIYNLLGNVVAEKAAAQNLNVVRTGTKKGKGE